MLAVHHLEGKMRPESESEHLSLALKIDWEKQKQHLSPHKVKISLKHRVAIKLLASQPLIQLVVSAELSNA